MKFFLEKKSHTQIILNLNETKKKDKMKTGKKSYYIVDVNIIVKLCISLKLKIGIELLVSCFV